MTLLLVAAVLPALFWDHGPDTAGQLKEAGITQVVVPPSLEAAWNSHAGISVRASDPQAAVKLIKPGVQYRANEASATRSPWVDSNGWEILRQPAARFYYDAPGEAAALAAAEAYMYEADALVHTDAPGLIPLGRVLAFLAKLKTSEMPAVANIGFADDGSPEAGEVMNLMVRKNLLFRIVRPSDARLDLNVPFGSAKYPKEEATDPGAMAQRIRFELTDQKRAVRIYGSEVVIVRLTGDRQRRRLQLLNYAARPVNGLRVRVLGRYTRHESSVFGVPDATLLDYEAGADASEFTLGELKSYAVIDLFR